MSEDLVTEVRSIRAERDRLAAEKRLEAGRRLAEAAGRCDSEKQVDNDREQVVIPFGPWLQMLDSKAAWDRAAAGGGA